MDKNDTIAAVCTGTGGAISILRISGPRAAEAVKKLWFGNTDPCADGEERKLLYGHALSADGEPCLAAFMPSPRTYTGDDVVEFHCHGGRMASHRLLEKITSDGIARMAEPGEFTRRAFLAGKLDLTQAEAVSDIIGAKTSAAFAIAEKQLSGSLGNRIKICRQKLVSAAAEMESHLDFPDEELDFKPREELLDAVRDGIKEMSELLETSKAGHLIREGVRLAVAGSPNVGKSSLMNRLLGFDRAIVSDVPGTTRDTLEESCVINGIQVKITDTAGLRDSTPDKIERLGMDRTKKAIGASDVVLWMLDASDEERFASETAALKSALLPPFCKLIPCWNKIDLLKKGKTLPEIDGFPLPSKISAVTGEGVDALCSRIAGDAVAAGALSEPEEAVSERHAEKLSSALDASETALKDLERNETELASASLRKAVYDLGSITGENASEELLDEIFSRFCIGK